MVISRAVHTRELQVSKTSLKKEKEDLVPNPPTDHNKNKRYKSTHKQQNMKTEKKKEKIAFIERMAGAHAKQVL